MSVSTHTRTRATAATETVECGRCGGAMESRSAAAPGLSYLVCGRCGHRLAGYDEVLRGRAGARTHRTDRREDAGWRRVRERAEQWWARLDAQDPWHVLGLTPATDFLTARRRFHELAGVHHPDRGGDPRRMREVLDAWHQVRARLTERGEDTRLVRRAR